MGDNKKWTRRAAVGSLVSGGGLMLFGTGGSTQITSNRDVTVNTGDGEDAVLQFVDVSDDATVVRAGSPSVVYEIRDNVGTFEPADIAVSARVVGGGGLDTTVTADGDAFDVAVSCSDDASGLRGSGTIELEFTASNPDFTITATRTTGLVDIDCYDFGSSNNYRDSGDVGTAAQPANPKGTLESPGSVNDGDGDTFATAVAAQRSKSDKKGGRVGYALPSVEPGGTYELNISYKNSNGSWNVYLKNKAGDEWTQEFSINGGGPDVQSKTINFNNTDNVKISNNADNLYLIFETTSNGNGVSVDIYSFELSRTGTKAN